MSTNSQTTATPTGLCQHDTLGWGSGGYYLSAAHAGQSGFTRMGKPTLQKRTALKRRWRLRTVTFGFKGTIMAGRQTTDMSLSSNLAEQRAATFNLAPGVGCVFG